MRRRMVPGLFVAVALVAAACGGRAPEVRPGGDGHEDGHEHGTEGHAEVSAELVAFGSTLWQARGHHLVALELLAEGEADAAATHAAHPLEEVLPGVEHELEEHDPAAATSLKQALRSAADGIGEASSREDAEAAVEEAVSALRAAEQAVGGQEAGSAAYRGSVVAGLLAGAAHEYEEALAEAEVEEGEYQDAYGFLLASRELYEEIAGDVEAAAAEEAREIEEAFEKLEAALPGPLPPESPADAEEVESAALLIGHELEETVGAVPATEADPEQVWSRIDGLLTQILAEYEEGERDEAAELAAEAYLENYELVEADVIRQAPEVNAELEPLLGAQLRAKIRANVPFAELEQMVDRARALLEQARTAVEAGE